MNEWILMETIGVPEKGLPDMVKKRKLTKYMIVENGEVTAWSCRLLGERYVQEDGEAGDGLNGSITSGVEEC